MFFIDIALMLALITIASITIDIDTLLVPVTLEKLRETHLPKTYQIKRRKVSCTPFPGTSIIGWCLTNGWSILLPSKLTRTGIMTRRLS